MKILFICNLSRQAGMMETTRKQLSLQGDFPAGSVVMATPRMTAMLKSSVSPRSSISRVWSRALLRFPGGRQNEI